MQRSHLLERTSPKQILETRSFEKGALNPPDLEPGSWIGAGDALVDRATKILWLTARWKRASEKGFSFFGLSGGQHDQDSP